MKVIVTRPRGQAQPLAGRIEGLGHEVVECPLIEIVRTSDEPIDCSGYEWAVVTSPNGADEVARRARNLPAKVAAVGPGTAETLRGHGIEPAFVASSLDGRPSRRGVSEARGKGALSRRRELAAGPDRRARGRLRAALQHRAARAGPAGGRCRRARLGLRRPRLRLDRRGCARDLDRPRDDARRRLGRARRRRRGDHVTTSTVSSPRSSGTPARTDVRADHVPDRFRAPGRLRRCLPGRDEADRT